MRSRRCASRGGTPTAWRIDPARVGIMGFSAGGGIAVGTALAERSDASPDFLVSLYGPSLQDVNVPAHAPPLFIAVGSIPLQRDQRLPGALRRVEGRGQARRNPRLRPGQRRLRDDEARAAC